MRSVCADISKAFDRVWHAGILHTFKNNGIAGSLNEWFSDYLTDRKQWEINGHSSKYGTIEAGVPHGSVLGPLLFLIFKEGLESKISLFADDSLFYMVSNLHNTNKDVLDRDLVRIYTWSKQWLVTFSIQKTFFTTNNNSSYAVIFFGANLESVSVHKHLGLTFSSDLLWNIHVDDINARADKRLCQLEALRFKLNRKILEILYIFYIRPIVEYSDVAFDNISDGDNTRLKIIQKRAGNIVSGAIKGTAYATILSELGWESLQARRERRKLILFADIVHGNALNYLQQDLPPSVQLRTHNRYQLRNRSDLRQFHTRAETFRNSFFPSTTNNWNSTDETIKNIDDRNNPKSYLYRSLPSKISYFCMYSRRINITLTRIRMQYSQLLYHLYQNHVADSPNCPCGVIETSRQNLTSTHVRFWRLKSIPAL